MYLYFWHIYAPSCTAGAFIAATPPAFIVTEVPEFISVVTPASAFILDPVFISTPWADSTLKESPVEISMVSSTSIITFPLTLIVKFPSTSIS